MVKLLLFALFSVSLLVPSVAPSEPQRRILLIGDSHTVGEFGQRLHERLQSDPEAAVASYGSWGSSPQWWLDGTPTTVRYRAWPWEGPRVAFDGAHATPTLGSLAGGAEVSEVIIALGSNLLGTDPDGWSPSVTDLLTEARGDSGRRCVWVGPPDMRRNGAGKSLTSGDFEAVIRVISQAAANAGCEWIDSRAFTRYPRFGGDGIHYDTIPLVGWFYARAWADAVFARIEGKNSVDFMVHFMVPGNPR